MEQVEIEHPVEGWNPVPGDPKSLVWWDGHVFTHTATRIGDAWEVVSVSDAGTPTTRDRAGGGAPRRRRRFGLVIGVVLGVPLAIFLLFAAIGFGSLALHEGRSPKDLQAELDTWKLPSTVTVR